uniref:Putative reverse transcriptase and intron maturase n=1 Tax=Gloeotilopsis planctonica TaxID=34157 RepID=A0A1B2RZ80_9CHLO|nr:putative reverse transcriptase and intron maturase [Gloeotilopsis planctonica]
MTSELFHPSENSHWNSINWKLVEKRIANLQHRITMATERGDNRKVRNLQRLLVRSLSGRLKAVRQVAQENHTKQMPGIDGKLWTTPQQKLQAALDLRKKSKTQPLRRIFIPKKNESTRPLGIPTVRDRAAQAVWNLAVLPVVEQNSDAASYGFRPYRSCWDAFAQTRVVFAKKESAKWVLEANICEMFDLIDRNWLLENTPMEKKVLKSWIKSGFFAGEISSHSESGIPQERVISPTLANLTLNGLEAFLEKRFPKGCRFNTQSKKSGYHTSKINVIRYADDFIVSGRSVRQLNRVRRAISEFLKPRGLKLHEGKTRITPIHKGFHFLGWKFWKAPNGAFLGQISRASVKAHQMNIKRIIKQSGNQPVPTLIRKLNEQITAWTNYHRCTDGLWKVWSKMDKYVYELLWKWARKRHGKRSHTWIYQRHWLHLNGRWTFFAKSPAENPSTSSNGEVKAEKLYTLKSHSARKMLVQRLPSSVNVFDLRNRKKIAEAWFLKQKDKLEGTRRLIWIRQKGICPVCSRELDFGLFDSVDFHHILTSFQTGTDKFAKLVLLHEHCHYVSHHKMAAKNPLPFAKAKAKVDRNA